MRSAPINCQLDAISIKRYLQRLAASLLRRDSPLEEERSVRNFREHRYPRTRPAISTGFARVHDYTRARLNVRAARIALCGQPCKPVHMWNTNPTGVR